MQLSITYFGQAREFAGGAREFLALAEGATLEDALRLAAGQHGPKLAQLLFDAAGSLRRNVLLVLNGAHAQGGALRDGDALTILPSISGG